MNIVNGLDENKVWLHAERVDGKIRVVDQHNRQVGGITNMTLTVDVEILPKSPLQQNARHSMMTVIFL